MTGYVLRSTRSAEAVKVDGAGARFLDAQRKRGAPSSVESASRPAGKTGKVVEDSEMVRDELSVLAAFLAVAEERSFTNGG